MECYVPKNFINTLNNHFGDDFKNIKSKHHKVLTSLIWKAYYHSDDIEHKKNDDNDDDFIFIFLSADKKRYFREVENLERYNERFDIYKEVVGHHFTSNAKGLAKGYALSVDLVKLLKNSDKQFIKEKQQCNDFNNSYGKLKTPISSKSEIITIGQNQNKKVTIVNTKETHKNQGLLNLIPINFNALVDLINAAEHFIENKDVSTVPVGALHNFNEWKKQSDLYGSIIGNELNRNVLQQAVKDKSLLYKKVYRIKCKAMSLIRMIMIKDNQHYVPIKYQESEAGRLFTYDYALSLQNVPKEVRKAALVGCYDIDFENCHWTIFYHEATKCGLNLLAVKDYLDNKKQYRTSIAQETGLSESKVKEGLIAIIYGSSSKAEYYCKKQKCKVKSDMYLKMGDYAFNKFESHSKVKALRNDIDSASKMIIEFYIDNRQFKNGFITNMFGKAKSIKDIYTKSKKDIASEHKRKLVSFILQGAERQMLDKVIQYLDGSKIMVLQHDGLTYTDNVSRNELDLIEAKILEETSIKIKIGDAELLH